MPRVGIGKDTKHFPYTEKGMEEAHKESKKGMPMKGGKKK